MLQVLVLAVLAASPSPLPSPAPAATATPGPLKTIATVHATTICAEIATRANSAIPAALADDATLDETIKALSAADVDQNVIKHRNSMDAFGDLAKKLNRQATDGDGEVKRLRKLAAESADPERKKELKAFADWLGGAIWRQKKVARDLNGMLATADYYDMSSLDESQQNIDIAIFGSPDQRPVSIGELSPTKPLAAPPIAGTRTGQPQGVFSPYRNIRPTLGQMAASAAKDFQLRQLAIASDESMAASHVTGATHGC